MENVKLTIVRVVAFDKQSLTRDLTEKSESDCGSFTYATGNGHTILRL
jgi:hypothetical protein